MNHVFLIDPPESLHTEKDTSFALMLEAQRQGHGVHVMLRGGITRQPGQILFKTRKAIVEDSATKPFTLSDYDETPAQNFDIVWIRTDPPFDTDYLTDTWLLSQIGARPLVLNAPQGLRNINEKIWAAQFTEIIK